MGGEPPMSTLVRFTLPLVAYLCVGTVITAALGYGYLRRSGKLNDETMFRITALLHGIDLNELAKESETMVEGAPAEEASFDEQQAHVHATSLRFDAKQKQLSDSLVQFQYQVNRVTAARERYDALRADVENFLNSMETELTNSDLANVRAQIEVMDPKKQAKPLLVNYMAAGEVDLVVKLLGSMKASNRRAILLTFNTDEDIKMLKQMQEHMLNENPAKAKIAEQLETLEQLKAEDK
jgi:hypothetical protein